jgi:hypothetical protein
VRKPQGTRHVLLGKDAREQIDELSKQSNRYAALLGFSNPANHNHHQGIPMAGKAQLFELPQYSIYTLFCQPKVTPKVADIDIFESLLALQEAISPAPACVRPSLPLRPLSGASGVSVVPLSRFAFCIFAGVVMTLSSPTPGMMNSNSYNL